MNANQKSDLIQSNDKPPKACNTPKTKTKQRPPFNIPSFIHVFDSAGVLVWDEDRNGYLGKSKGNPIIAPQKAPPVI